MPPSSRYLLVGLGNPGGDYAQNRHNVGFMCLDEIRSSYGFPAERAKFSGLLSEGSVDRQKVVLFKPLSYMNLSGRPVAETAGFFKIPPEQLIVFHDDLDLSPGTVRVKQGGGNGGHNGLKDLDAHLGPNYWRVRIGIGRPLHKESVPLYVLSNFSKEDRQWLSFLLPLMADDLPLLFSPLPQGYGTHLTKLTTMETSRGS